MVKKVFRYLLLASTLTITFVVCGCLAFYSFFFLPASKSSTSDSTINGYSYNSSSSFLTSSINQVSSREESSSSINQVSSKEESSSSYNSSEQETDPPSTHSSSLNDYYIDYLDDKLYTINKIYEQNDIDFSFAFLTDLHWTVNAQKSPLLLKEIEKNINLDKVVLGGDYINQDYDDVEEAKSLLRECVSSFSSFNYTAIVGNHDTNNNFQTGTIQIPDEEVFSIINNVDSPFPYKCEKDYSKKICLLFLSSSNGSFSNTNQKEFVSNTLGGLDNSWSVAIFIHIIFDGSYGNNNLSVIQPAGIQFTNFLNSIYPDIDCNVIGVFSGHSHLDYLNTTSYCCPIVTTMCDSIGRFTPRYNIYRREIETTTEQAFDIVQIDTTSHKVFLTRIGCGSDRDFIY